jgi:UDP-N-acetyl-2-amino-2-deoxyglucuronate dehydrogenase
MDVGLIGAGNISATHARAAAEIPGVRIAAVCAPTRAHAAELASKYGAAVFDSVDALVSHRPLDAVIVGSPSGLHAEHGIAAAARGLHVLVEKPIDTSLERTDALIAQADRVGVTLGVIFQDRLKPDIRRMKAAIDGGRLGTPILATAQVKWYRTPGYYASSHWRGTPALDGGGALMNQGVHTVDLLLWLFGPVRRVSASVATRLHDIAVEDTAVAILEFANGALGTIEAATSAFPGYPRRLELTGSSGTLRLEGDDLVGVDLPDARDDERAASPPRTVESAASPVVSDATPHRRVLKDFIEAVRTGRPAACDGREGRRSVELIQAIYQSAYSGRPVELSPA